jgi:translation initiation factor IF-3
VFPVPSHSKYKYEQAQKVKQARKHQQQITVREIKFRPKIAEHDYDTKKHHVERFLRHKDKVKVTIMFRGREVTHPERGTAILDRLAEELAELGVVEQRPIQEGRNMTMMMAPSKAVLTGKADDEEAADEVFADGESGDVAQTALESPLGADVTPTNESPEVADPPADSAEEPAETPAEDSEEAADVAVETPAQDAAETPAETADASADPAVS